MAGKRKTPEEQISDLVKRINDTLIRWTHLYECGCNDPFWPDGTNLNLLRNHVSYFKSKITEICREHEIELPEGYYSPLPPYIDQNYFAKPDSERAIKIRGEWTYTNAEPVNITINEIQQGTLF